MRKFFGRWSRRLLPIFLTGGLFAARLVAAAPVVETDVCIYGATSGGIVAAVELARMGKSVELLNPNVHLGGMTAGGLSSTDIGNAVTIGGIAREFYQRVGAYYGRPETFVFEPKVATQVFADLLREAAVVPRQNQKLRSVTKQGTTITELRTASGLRIRAKVFIDATYEGDLMARAGVSFTVGREGADVYGESLAGVTEYSHLGQFDLPVDPFRRFGQWRSGLLPWLHGAAIGLKGDGDEAVQAYNYRLCLTNVPAQRRRIKAPMNYREADYQVLARYIAARSGAGSPVKLSDLLHFDPLPNGKFDINANGPFSTDCVGLSAYYPGASDAKRAVLALAHRRYIQGLLYFLGNSRSVPQELREAMLRYGPCTDEFKVNAGWPPQLYVREARRMIGAYVMQQGDCVGLRRTNDPVALGSYAMDSHMCHRVAEDGAAKNEGGFYVGLHQPYRISYRALVPQASECSNLLVTFAVSASHVAFGSLRMEPVFMMLSQGAAQAAVLAIDGRQSVQDVDYTKLAPRLAARGQVLKWPLPPAGSVTIDNTDPGATVVGTWTRSSQIPGFFGEDYAMANGSPTSDATFRFTPQIPAAGAYDVYFRWTSAYNRAPSVSVDVIAEDGVHTVQVDQTHGGADWFRLGRWNFAAGQTGALVVRAAGAKGIVVVDAASWVPAAQPFMVPDGQVKIGEESGAGNGG